MKWFSRSAIVAGGLVVTLVAAAGLYAASINGNVQRADILTVSAGAAPQSAAGALNILIVGQQPVAAGAESADVVSLLHLSKDRQSAHLVSFPRGVVATVGGKPTALSDTYAQGGAKLTVKALQTLTSTRVDHVIVVGYSGFESMIRQVGTISINNPTAFKNGGSTFAKGTLRLSSAQALAYVQQRTGVANEDTMKPERQRRVLEATLQQGIGKGLLKNPAKFGRFINTVSKDTTVDRALTAKEAVKIGTSMRLAKNDMQIVRVPLSATPKVVAGKEVTTVDAAQFKELTKALATDTLTAYAEKYPSKDGS
jgi:LCP family protein required for cell wall assembly